MSSSQNPEENWFLLQNKKRANRALERQREYQAKKSRLLAGNEKSVVLSMFGSSQKVRKMIEAVKPVKPDAKILEVGSGAHGLVFEFGNEFRVGVDPLAVEYAGFFPYWQHKVPTVAAGGEKLPFADESFDVVISDNVIDHAEKPLQIIEELVRVLKVGGVLYFTVNVHHRFYSIASDVYGVYKALGLPFEVTPFADHTVHLTAAQVQKTFAKLPLEIVHQAVSRIETRNIQRRHIGDNIKRIFFKNALFELLSVRQ
jgi:ubiquinone/menaquinone biosynthesis C-methylase UbiE